MNARALLDGLNRVSREVLVEGVIDYLYQRKPPGKMNDDFEKVKPTLFHINNSLSDPSPCIDWRPGWHNR